MRKPEKQAGAQASEHDGGEEIKFHLNVEPHDYATKLNHITDFLQKGQRVKTSLMFRGRENEHRDLGYASSKGCCAIAKSWRRRSPPKLFGHNLIMLLKPQKSGKAEGGGPRPRAGIQSAAQRRPPPDLPVPA